MENTKFNFIKPKKVSKLKFDNSFKVSYPDQLYEKIRRHAFRKGISLQEMQRKCAEFYINHLEQDEIVSQKFKS
jgi:hypothetical protein